MNFKDVKIKNIHLLFMLLWFTGLLTFAVTRLPGGLDVDSCNYAVVAKEILRSGNWLQLYDPVYGGVFYYHFPLCIWATALIFKIAGVASFTAKLFSMFSGLFLVGTLFYFGKTLKNYWVGFFAGLSLLLTNHVIRLAMQCRMDIPVTLFISLALYAFILAQKYNRRFYLLFGIFTALAIMAKDVFGLFPPVIVFVYLVLTGKWKELFRPLFLAGLLLSVLPVLLWILLDKGSLVIPWFRWNFIHLLSSPGFNVPWYYYLWAIFTKYFYFLPLAVYGGYLAVMRARRERDDPLLLILIIWAVIFPLAFSFGRQKLHYFIIPMYPAASLLVGLAADGIFRESLKVKIAAVFKYILIIGTLVLLFFPLDLRSKRFVEAVEMSGGIDGILKQLDKYDFFVYKYDTAAILFYSQQLSRVKTLNSQVELLEALAAPLREARLVFMPQEDFLELDDSIKDDYRQLFRFQDRILVIDKFVSRPEVILSR
jgi:4-amino-4-deoxy-L-arabinose transferase-like glycosyltransferase